MCHWENVDCVNGKYKWGVQFSPAPPTPISSTVFHENQEACNNTLDQDLSVEYSKSFLREIDYSLKVTFRGASKDNGQSCLEVVEHPNIPSAVNPNLCNDVANYSDLKGFNGWNYNALTWRKNVISNPNVFVFGVRIKLHFRDKQTGKKVSGKIITIIK